MRWLPICSRAARWIPLKSSMVYRRSVTRGMLILGPCGFGSRSSVSPNGKDGHGGRLVNVPDVIEVSDFGRIVFEGNTVAGSGPLDGFNAFPRSEFSSDPALAALELPFPFPTDFSDPVGFRADRDAGEQRERQRRHLCLHPTSPFAASTSASVRH